MNYVKQSDNSVVSIYDIRRENPDSSIPEGCDCGHLGYEFLVETAPPKQLPWHCVKQAAPINNTQTWIQEELSHQEIISICLDAVQKRLDEFAQTRNYDNMLSACTYATSSNPVFKADAQRCVDIRDSTWAKCYEILNEVRTGARPMPSLEQFINELPILTWAE